VGDRSNGRTIAGIVIGAIALSILTAILYVRDKPQVSRVEDISTDAPFINELASMPRGSGSATADISPVPMAAPEPEEKVQINAYTFSGKIKDKRNAPMEGVSVGLTGRSEYFTLTDDEGRFQLSEVKKGRYSVELKKAHWGHHSEYLKIAGDVEKDFEFLHDLVFRGKVVEAYTGQAVELFKIGIYRDEKHGLKFDGKEIHTLLDTKGRFEIRPPNDIRMEYLNIIATGYANKRIPIEKLSVDSENLIELTPAEGSHEGIVYAPGGKPQPGALIFTSGIIRGENAHNSADAITDSEGRFRFRVDTSSPHKPFVVNADHKNYAPGMYTALVSEIPRGPIKIALREAGSIRVHVTSNGEDVPDQSMEMIFDDEIQLGEWKGETDTNGILQFDGLPEGSARIILKNISKIPAMLILLNADAKNITSMNYAAETIVRAGIVTEIAVTLDTASASLEGHITKGGQPYAGDGAVLLALPSADGTLLLQIDIDEEGNYFIEHLLPGQGIISIIDEESDSVRIRSIKTTLLDEIANHLDIELDEGNASLHMMVTGDWQNTVGFVILFKGHRDLNDDLEAALYELFLEERIDPDICYFGFNFELSSKRSDMEIAAPYLAPGNYTVFAVQLDDDLFIDLDTIPLILEHITLEENEEKILEYRLE
jgi:hypothetical protein